MKKILLHKFIFLYIITNIIFLLQNTALASIFTLEAPSRAQQGAAILATAVSKIPVSTASFSWLEKKITVPFKKHGSLWKAQTLLPIPLDSIGNKTLTVQTQKNHAQLNISIDKVCWPIQNITMKEEKKKFVAPSKNLEKRIKEERQTLLKTLSTISCFQYWNKPFIKPVPGIVTSQFGGKRFFNGKQCSYHTGVDLRGATGTPIKAVAAGKVVISKDLYYAGKTVVIDHGQGIFTLYCHMSQRKAKVGDIVAAGQQIGLVGTTGRSTGPHLHLGLKILGYYVDPMSLFPQ